MATFAPGIPITVGEPQLLVENRLKPGRYRFQLVVTDDGGLESDPAELVVTIHQVVRPERPIGPFVRPGIRPDILDVVGPRRPGIVRPIRPIRRPP